MLLAAALVLCASAGCGSTSTTPGTSDATVHLQAVGARWRGGYPVDEMNVATLSARGRLVGWGAGRNRLPTDNLALSPDGLRVLTIGQGIVQLYSSSTGSVRTLCHLGSLRDPEWLPDGVHFSVIHWFGNSDRRTLLVADAQHCHITQRLRLPPSTDVTAFSADGSRLVVAEVQLGGASAGSTIALVDPDSGHATPLRTLPRDLVDGLAWSPDGRRIAYASWKRGAHVMNADGSDDRALWKPQYGFVGISPGSFSPDGGTLAVSWQADFNGADAMSPQRGMLLAVADGRAVQMAARGDSIAGPFVWVDGPPAS